MPPFYDAMISKLVAWGDDRPHAIARMRRGLREYEVRGIRTTVSFFQWLLDQPSFIAGDFHTGLLDELLHERQGQPFSTAEASLDEVASIAAALFHLTRSSAPPAAPPPVSGWRRDARLSGLRG